MSKVICDVCGTTYPDTASSCPICGCAARQPSQTVAGGAQDQNGSYNYVKGGRFSKGNVRKRNSKKVVKEPRSNMPKGDDEGANKGLVIVVLVLLLAIVAVLVYIGIRVLGSVEAPKPNTQNPGQQGSQVNKIPCVGLSLETPTIEFSAPEETFGLRVNKQPADTTETVIYMSANPHIATVDEFGNVVSVGVGQTVIYVICGDYTVQCTVICSDGSTQPTEPPVDPLAGYELRLNRTDFTLTKQSEIWNLFKKNEYGVTAEDITWSVDNPNVATVDSKGNVKGVNKGSTTVWASFRGQMVSCIVRVAFVAAPESNYKVSISDVTISVGESLTVNLLHKTNSAPVQGIVWTPKTEGIVSVNGTKITGEQIGDVTLSTTYEGETFTCIVRVKAATQSNPE